MNIKLNKGLTMCVLEGVNAISYCTSPQPPPQKRFIYGLGSKSDWKK